MFCTKCGRKLVDGREICSVCGAVNKTVTNALWPQLEELLSQKMVAIVAWILTAVLAVGNVCTWIPSGLSLGASHRTAMSTTKDFVAALCEGDSKRMISCCIVEYGMVGGGLMGWTPAQVLEKTSHSFQGKDVSDFKFTPYQDNYVFVQADDYIIGIYCSKVDGEYLIYDMLLSKVTENTGLYSFMYNCEPAGKYWSGVMEDAGIEFN